MTETIFVQLLHDLRSRIMLSPYVGNRHARGIFPQGRGDIEGINISAAAGKQAGHTRDNTPGSFSTSTERTCLFIFRALP